MTSPPPVPAAHRPFRVLLDAAIRAVGLVAVAEALSAMSSENDALALGLGLFFDLAVVAFAVALLDGILRRDRARLVIVWALVLPLVALLEVALDIGRTMYGPGSYPTLAAAIAASRPDVLWFSVLIMLLVSVPAAAGIGLGLLVRPRPSTGPRTRGRQSAPTAGGVR